MNITRRDFLKISGAATGFLLASSTFDLVKVPKALADMGTKTGVETTSICCCCACGCGMLITTENPGTSSENVINVEGDPTHPVNQGGLCSKCLAARQTVSTQRPTAADFLAMYPSISLDPDGQPSYGERLKKWPKGKRLTRVLHRAANDHKWTVVSWSTALGLMGNRIATTRAAGWEAHDGSMTVNRSNNIAALGGAAHDNQECYLMRKLFTGLGLVYIEHQARI